MSDRIQMPGENESMIYDLIAVDNHYGGLGGGHYTAYARNFVDGNWYEFNDSHVTMKRDPSSVVTSAAYLLFYRRRSTRPLGGDFLAKLTEMAHDRNSDSESAESRSGSPPASGSGEGKRLGGLSRNGSSSALRGAAATRQSGDGGLPTGTQAKSDDEPPNYSHVPVSGERNIRLSHLEGMDEEEEADEGFDGTFQAGSAIFAQQPSWSYDRLSNNPQDEMDNAFGGPPGSYYEGEDNDDAASTQAERGEGDLSEFDRSFEQDAADDDTGMVFSSILDDDENENHGVSIGPDLDNDYDDTPAVIEVRVGDEELQ
ncbi:hypothetical protein FQN49_007313 [Arthroderma sp. PD_2]|nr:hypothetical protein FQN49_007313 [Arthroderma sp. PD_2]